MGLVVHLARQVHDRETPQIGQSADVQGLFFLDEFDIFLPRIDRRLRMAQRGKAQAKRKQAMKQGAALHGQAIL